MVVVINKAPTGYNTPSREKARTVLIDECVRDVEKDLAPVKDIPYKRGWKNGGKIFNFLLEVIESIGLINVLQVITDNAANCKATRDEVEKECRKNLAIIIVLNSLRDWAKKRDENTRKNGQIVCETIRSDEFWDDVDRLYSRPKAQIDVVTMDLIDWWSIYGLETPKLAEIAKKVLSQLVNSRYVVENVLMGYRGAYVRNEGNKKYTKYTKEEPMLGMKGTRSTPSTRKEILVNVAPTDNYSPVTWITSIRMVLAIAAIRNIEVYQMDVKTAFLNGDLEEEIYMKQPKRFIASGQEGKVYVILGVKITRTQNGLVRSQKHLVDKILEKYNPDDSYIARTPIDTTNNLSKNRGRGVNHARYLSIIGSLMYLMYCTRPDLAYAADISISTMESEFIALDKCTEKAEWLCQFVEDIP
nr:putative histone acetyltransferase HAC-like 1 [Tanacetum cinerariifolium]